MASDPWKSRDGSSILCYLMGSPSIGDLNVSMDQHRYTTTFRIFMLPFATSSTVLFDGVNSLHQLLMIKCTIECG